MEITIRTSGASWVTELASSPTGDENPGWGAEQVWQNLLSVSALRARVKQATGRGGPECLVVLNPAHVIHVSEEAN